MSLLQNSNAISAGGYDINNSLRFRRSASAYLSRTFTTPTNNKIWTWSGWVKKSGLALSQVFMGYGVSGTLDYFGFNTSDQLYYFSVDSGGGVQRANYNTLAVFRDPSAWYHVVFAVDTTQATASNRFKLYVNGVQQTLTTTTSLALNWNTYINSALSHGIGYVFDGGTPYLDGYLSEVNFIDGQALTPSSFGETDAVTGSWTAKKYTGTYGINGFYLPFNHTETNENLLTYSEQFDNAAWNKVNFTATANSIASPLGSVVADRILETTANSLHACLPTSSLGISPNLTYTFSTYIKSINNQYVQLVFDDNTTTHGGYANFDLTSGTITQSGNYGAGSNVKAAIQSLGNGWYRISVSTKVGSGSNGRASINGIQSGSWGVFAGYVGNASNGYYVWGAQINYGSVANDYILTTASIVNQRGTTENAFTYSQDFTNASWTKSNSSITANTTTAPDGTNTASKLVENTSNSGHVFYKSFTETNITRTLSLYAKLADASRPYIWVDISNLSTADVSAIFNISNGTLFSVSSANADYSNISTSITPVGNGWYRCTVTATKGSSNTTNAPLIGVCDASGNTYYAGSGTTLGVFIWGAQFEESSSVGPYWPTTASAQSKIFRIGADKSLGATGFGYDSWIPNNISLTYGSTYDAMTDSPTLTSATVSNYGVFNSLDKNTSITVSNANLAVTSASTNVGARGTFGVSSGKWYYEGVILAKGSADQIFGVALSTWDLSYVGANNGVGYGGSGSIYSPLVAPPGIASFTTGDIIGVAFDVDALTVSFYKNGSLQGTYSLPSIGNSFYFAAVSVQNGTLAINCGQQPFLYTPPTGYKALNTYNLPDSTIKKGNRYMDATTYTGNGSSQSITNAGSMKSDLLWTKSRSAATDNYLFDSIRGEGGILISNSTIAETVLGPQMAFNSNGFTVGGLAAMNTNGATYVGWQWQAGQGSTSTNTNGTITTTTSVNATAGISIVTYTGVNNNAGGTIGHGLGVAPAFVIVKRRDSTGNWIAALNTYGSGLANYRLNTTDTAFSSWVPIDNSGGMTSSSVLVLSYTGGGVAADMLNNVGATYVAYCFAPIAGFSKFGTYQNTGSTDGRFVYLGFRPKFLMIKCTDAGEAWYIHIMLAVEQH